jgi:hypothetical protein
MIIEDLDRLERPGLVQRHDLSKLAKNTVDYNQGRGHQEKTQQLIGATI